MTVESISANPLHLLRAILRECTYLPDQRACSYIHKYALSRFRTYQDVKGLPSHRRMHVMQKARKGLSVLRRANEGYINPLQRILWATYGRIGRRRRQLMAQIMTPQVQEDPSAVGTLDLAPKYDLAWKPSELFTALLKSQSQHTSRLDRRLRGRASKNVKMDREIPEMNRWGRPMPLKRVKNMTRKWYAKSADSLFPPLPDHEWEHLRKLAEGKISCSSLKQRRKAAQTNGTRNGQLLKDDILVAGPPKAERNQKCINGWPHKLTPRFLQRRYALMLTSTPVVAWDESRKKWNVKWGGRPTPDSFKPASNVQQDLFFSDEEDQAKGLNV